ncbi:unnamed protein product, partial [Brenthis ino]
MSAQRLSDQRRSIVNNKLLSSQKLLQIRKDIQNNYKYENKQYDSIRHSNESSNTQKQIPPFSPAANTSVNTVIDKGIPQDINTTVPSTFHTQNLPQTSVLDNRQTEDISLEVNQEIENLFQETLHYNIKTDPTCRTYIPKQKLSKKFCAILNYINTITLPKYIDPNIDFSTLQNIIYSAAWTAAKLNGSILHQNNKVQPEKKAKWQVRLEKKIDNLRVKIGKMTQYINGNKSEKLAYQIQQIQNQYKTHSTHEGPNTEPIHFHNEKTFYRSISAISSNHTASTPQNIPSPEELRNYWADLWETSTEHNDKAEWIKTEINHHNDITQMEFESIPIEIFNKAVVSPHRLTLYKVMSKRHVCHNTCLNDTVLL